MVIGQDRGILVAVFAIAAALLGGVVSDMAMDPALFDLVTGIGFIIAAVPTWLLGRKWNREPERVLTDEATGDQVVFRRRHSLFFIPMHWWAVPLLLLGPLTMLGGDQPIDFGDDSGEYAFDGECDDNRFTGPAVFFVYWPEGEYNGRDATDCRAHYESGSIRLRTSPGETR